MTQKQFKEALLRGQGRCVKAAKANRQKYFSVVLWACSHEVTFDTQCEGSRAWFVYQLIKCYDDKTPFLETASECLMNTRSSIGWKVHYLAELLNCFAADGEETAKQALWRKYEQLYSVLRARTRPKNGMFHERDDLESLCKILAQEEVSFLKIAEDIGRLYREKPSLYDGSDFYELYLSKAKRCLKTLERQAQKSENIAKYLRAGQAYEMEFEEIYKKNRNIVPKTGIALSNLLKKQADSETILKYAEVYLAQRDPEERAEALSVFFRCPFPLDPQPIIEDARSDCEKLKKTAWRALENIRHPLVREFSIKNLQNDLEAALPLFIVNYQEQDENLLVDIVKSIPVDFECTTIWHGAQLEVLNMADRGLKAPAELLKYIYESTYCSCCRERALRQMGKRRLLTDDVLQECLFDSHEDIRAYAKRCLKRRNKKAGMENA